MPKELSSHLRAPAHRCLSPVQTCPRFTPPVDFSTRGSQRRLDRMAKLAIPDLAFPLHAAAVKSRHSRGHLTHLPLSPTPLRVYHLNAYLLSTAILLSSLSWTVTTAPSMVSQHHVSRSNLSSSLNPHHVLKT